MSIEPVTFALPPTKSLIWLPPLILQAALLHPSITRGPHASLARFTRQALVPIIIYLALFIPTQKLGLFEPKERCVPFNFAYSVARPWAVMKALEWGVSRAAERYRYVGIVQGDGGGGRRDGRNGLESTAETYSFFEHASTTLSLGFKSVLLPPIPF
jgi:hypothetical protein